MEYDHPGPSRRTASRATRTTGRSVIVAAALRPVAAAARRIGAAQSDERPGRQERDAVPLRQDRAERSGRGGGFGGGRGGRGGGARATIDLSKPVTLSAYGEYTKKAGFYELADGKLQRARVRGRVVQHAAARGQGRHVPVHATDLHRVPGPARIGAGLRGLPPITRRESAAGRILVGPPHPVRFQEQGRAQAAGHSRASRRLQARREAADAGELLRGELAEPAPLQRAVLPERHGLVADPGRERGLHHDAARRALPHGRVAQRHARVRRSGGEEGDRDGLRRSRSGSGSTGTATAARARRSLARGRGCSRRWAWAPA